MRSQLGCMHGVLCFMWASMASVALLSTLSASYLRVITLHGKTMPKSGARSNPALLPRVSKSWFTHFYALGLFANLFAIYTLSVPGSNLSPWLGGCSARLHPGDVLPALVLFETHLLRRFYECLMVHQWGSSSISLEAYAVGMTHYVMVPLSFASLVDPNTEARIFGARQWAGALIMTISQGVQCYWHVYLSSLRRDRADTKNVEEGKRLSLVKNVYKLPQGILFRWTCCPHYLAEILIYIGAFLTVSTLSEPTLLAMLTWVVANLAVSAKRVSSWYREKFSEDFESLYCMIPGVF